MKLSREIFFGLVTVIATIIVLMFNRFSFQPAKDGTMLRLDRLTGQTIRIEGDKMVRVASPGEVEKVQRLQTAESVKQQRTALETRAAATKEWNVLLAAVDKTATTKLRTKWVGGTMYYAIIVTPLTGPMEKFIKNSDNEFTLHFKDKEQFDLEDIRLSVSDFKIMVEADPNAGADALKHEGIGCQGAREMPVEKYLMLESWSLSWRFAQRSE